jgi:hypothetical protein
MHHLKMIGLAALAAMALMAVAAGSASATTLEIHGVTKNSSVSLEASLKAGSSAILRQTSADFVDTCTSSTVKGATSTFTGTTVSGGISTLTFGNCTHTTHVHKPGSLSVEHIKNTTNGTVRSSGAQVTVQSTTFGATLNCTANNTHLGVLTGTADTTKHASLKINAVVNCGFFVPSALWEGEYTVTSPTGLGVSA